MEIAIDVFQAILLKSKTSSYPIKVFIFSLDSSHLNRFYLKGEPTCVNWFSGRHQQFNGTKDLLRTSKFGKRFLTKKASRIPTLMEIFLFTDSVTDSVKEKINLCILTFRQIVTFLALRTFQITLSQIRRGLAQIKLCKLAFRQILTLIVFGIF